MLLEMSVTFPNNRVVRWIVISQMKNLSLRESKWFVIPSVSFTLSISCILCWTLYVEGWECYYVRMMGKGLLTNSMFEFMYQASASW